jgi:hypothetical protein
MPEKITTTPIRYSALELHTFSCHIGLIFDPVGKWALFAFLNSESMLAIQRRWSLKVFLDFSVLASTHLNSKDCAALFLPLQ